MAGTVTPFVERVRDRLERELRDAHQAEIASLKMEYENRIDELQKNQQTDQAQRLRDRLMRLAGFGRPS